MKDFLPYFAGYIDGDGHFRFRKYIQKGHECFHCKIMITSTCEEPFKFFIKNLGGSYYAKSKTQQKWKQEYIYTFHVSQKTFDEISSLIRPHHVQREEMINQLKSIIETFEV